MRLNLLPNSLRTGSKNLHLKIARTKTGIAPENFQGDPVNSTRFLDNAYLYEAYKRATPDTPLVVFTHDVAEGYYKGGKTYGTTNRARVRFNSDGLPYTAYGILPTLPK